ncbi:MAG: hypothetical protein KGJ55_09320, partial [Gammaproteobacteria bacterium]|nr:hypothetical protein [Gammaproteobacteria bacterium]
AHCTPSGTEYKQIHGYTMTLSRRAKTLQPVLPQQLSVNTQGKFGNNFGLEPVRVNPALRPQSFSCRARRGWRAGRCIGFYTELLAHIFGIHR